MTIWFPGSVWLFSKCGFSFREHRRGQREQSNGRSERADSICIIQSYQESWEKHNNWFVQIKQSDPHTSYQRQRSNGGIVATIITLEKWPGHNDDDSPGLSERVRAYKCFKNNVTRFLYPSGFGWSSHRLNLKMSVMMLHHFTHWMLPFQNNLTSIIRKYLKWIHNFFFYCMYVTVVYSIFTSTTEANRPLFEILFLIHSNLSCLI